MTSTGVASPGPESAVRALLVTLADDIVTQGVALREQPSSSTHRTRVSLRRLRSLLATFDPLLDTTVTRPLRTELKWLFVHLGAARDLEVLSARLSQPSSQHPETTQLIVDSLAGAHARAVERARAELDSTRCVRLLAGLALFGARPPVLAEIDEGVSVRTCINEDLERVRHRMVTASPAPTTPPEQLHEVRKAAKRLRYSAESQVPVQGADARRLVRRAARLQEALGEVQDSTLAQEFLRELATAATPAQAFFLGHLCEAEHRAARAGLAGYARGREQLMNSRPRWLE